MDNEAPKKKNRRYFFAWHLVNGIPFAFKYVTEGGLPIGGVPNTSGTVVEITEEEFQTPPIADLAKEHPYDGVRPDTDVTLPDDTDGV